MFKNKYRMIFMNNTPNSFQNIQSKIYTIRGIKVMLDRELASLYGVTTGNLNKSIKRNIERFPYDFMFQLNKEEYASLRFQIGILNQGSHSKYLPYVFTEMGVAMLASVLNSKTAIEINILIMRAFVELRQIITSQPEYALLKETVKRIESRMDTIESNHLVDQVLVSGKTNKLSQEVQNVRTEVRHISELFDHFQEAHILIKRPEDGINS
jgi:phage regulator Rha-like protein